MDFRDRVVLVTGGSSGIGLATARLLAQAGAHVWLVARDPSRLAAALVEVEAARATAGQQCGAAPADVSDPGQAAAAVRHVCDVVGVPDLVINSAGVVHPGYFQDLELELFRRTMDINFFGTLHVIQAVVPAMIQRGSGHIVNISSLAGVVGTFGYTAYGASKFAVSGFSNALRLELKPLGIQVSVVFPPDTDTPQLAYDNQHKPPETHALAGNVRAMSAEAVAQSILRGVRRQQYAIVPGLDGKLAFWLSGTGGAGLNLIQDFLLARARRQIAHQSQSRSGPSGKAGVLPPSDR